MPRYRVVLHVDVKERREQGFTRRNPMILVDADSMQQAIEYAKSYYDVNFPLSGENDVNHISQSVSTE